MKKLIAMNARVKNGTATEQDKKVVNAIGFTAIGLSAVGTVTILKTIVKRVFRRHK